ncbi:hypothetical protein EMCRGX_G033882 [Ephydatia muelleri]|eukprot:Em0022g358a
MLRRVGWQCLRLSQSCAKPTNNFGPVFARYFAEKYDAAYFDKLVKEKPLVLFMKGEPTAPRCGFSRLVVQILHMHGVEKYDSYDVLEDVEFKEAMKKYSNWPTFPQLYVNGELVGGADIVLQMHQNGALVEELEKIGHRSALLDKDKKDS